MNERIRKEVGAILLDVTTFERSDLMDTLIKDGYAKYKDVYTKVPETELQKKQLSVFLK